jgi:octaprenyl-diphosphate synthase
MQHGNDSQKQIIRHAIENGERDRIDTIITIIQETGAIAYTNQAALKEAQNAKKALEPLPNSIYKKALLSLADFSVERHY